MKKNSLILTVMSLIFSWAMLSCDYVNDYSCKRHRSDASFDKIYGYGIDISHHNAEPMWDNLDVDFIILKASEGTTYQDPAFSRRAKHAAQKDIPVGAYHFFSGSSNPAGEFNNFQKQIKDKIDIIPVIDIERKPKSVSKKVFQKRFLMFMSLVKKTYGVYPIIYTSEGFYYRFLKEPIERKITDDTEVLLWFGDVGKKYKNYSLPPHIHQAQIKKVKGIKGKVDFNELHCDIKKLLLPAYVNQLADT